MEKRDWSRDAERSKQAILDAAEECFANQGYDTTSIREIAERAGLSRGTPRYFFGSKEQLYQAVLERRFTEMRTAIATVRAGLPATASPAQLLGTAVESYLDFLSTRPTFVRLMARESLQVNSTTSRLPSHLQSLQEALAALAGMGEPPISQEELVRLLISLIALCWFPIAHDETLLQPLGVTIHNPAFRARWVEHVRHLLLAGLGGSDQAPRTGAPTP